MHKRVLICVAFAAACGKSSATTKSNASGASGASAAPPSAPAADGPMDKCEIHISGDEKLDVAPQVAHSDTTANGGKVMAGTEYWMTDDDVRSALKTMAGVMSKKSDDEIATEVEADMKKDPRLMLLLVNCSNDDAHINFGPTETSHYADVPFGPKKYALVGKDAKAGEFTGMFGFTPPGGQRQSYSIDGPGTFDITKFDKTGIAGTFHFAATTFKGDKHVTVDGKFDYGCRGSVCAK
jgi:hypothetical protein